MTSKKDSWIAQVSATIGVALWIGATMYFGLYPIAVLIMVFAVPATIANIAREAMSVEPVLQ